MAELVPYFQGMQRGQGYNTYVQKRCIDKAVTVDDGQPPSAGYDVHYNSELITTYEKLAKSFNMSAGAAITGYGQSAPVDVEYLDRSEFEISTLTYQVTVDCQSQPSTKSHYSFNQISSANPNETYGDRFISDFIRGGHFFARVSIFTQDKSSTKTAFAMYGVGVEVTQKVKTAVENIQKLSEVRIVVNKSTGTTANGAEGGNTFSDDLLAVKTMADKFYADADAGKHNYIRFALLGEYKTLSNFGNYFSPLDYKAANERSWELFDDFMNYQSFGKLITDIPADKFIDGASKRSALESQRIDELEKIREKIEKIRLDPNDSRHPGTHIPPTDFRLSVLVAVKTTTYIAQNKDTSGDGNWTDIAQKTLAPGATKIFEFKAFEFGNVMGTHVVSFGKSTSKEEYICLIGERAGDISGWKEESYFWIFRDGVAKFANQKVAVSRLDAKQYIRLAKAAANQPDAKAMWDFFAI